MLKQLRFDGYKLIHSRTLWVVYAVAFLFALITPVAEAIDGYSVFWVLRHTSNSAMIQISVVLFVAFFVGADYRSGYVKTVISRVEWAKYVISKLIYIFVFCILWVCVYHLLLLAIIPMGGGGLVGTTAKWVGDELEGEWVYAKEQYNFGLLYCKLLWMGTGAFAYGVLVMFVLMASKSTLIALVFGLVYYFLAPAYLYPAINSLLINGFGVKEQTYIIQKYTLAAPDWVYDGFAWDPIKLKTEDLLLYHFGILFYTLLYSGFSILICYKRKRKS